MESYYFPHKHKQIFCVYVCTTCREEKKIHQAARFLYNFTYKLCERVIDPFKQEPIRIEVYK